MAKVIVVYKSKYGNTKLVAETIREGMNEVEGIEAWQAPLKERTFAVFDTYFRGDFEKTVKKMEKRITEKTPRSKQMAPGLSIKVQGVKGPIVEGELSKCKEFGNKIANQLKT